jgi:3'-phosphoadenosine 5'-phosphosulfate sulfotransferase (PAPS reductase)/FAD synthetase
MTENEFLLRDRIAKIKSINEQYDLENNAYLSFSGGKDSTVLHYLLDEALPENKIPRLFLNTGIEYIYIQFC